MIKQLRISNKIDNNKTYLFLTIKVKLLKKSLQVPAEIWCFSVVEIGLTGSLNKYYFGFLDTRLNKYYFGASPKSSPKFLHTKLNKYYFWCKTDSYSFIDLGDTL